MERLASESFAKFAVFPGCIWSWRLDNHKCMKHLAELGQYPIDLYEQAGCLRGYWFRSGCVSVCIKFRYPRVTVMPAGAPRPTLLCLHHLKVYAY